MRLPHQRPGLESAWGRPEQWRLAVSLHRITWVLSPLLACHILLAIAWSLGEGQPAQRPCRLLQLGPGDSRIGDCRGCCHEKEPSPVNIQKHAHCETFPGSIHRMSQIWWQPVRGVSFNKSSNDTCGTTAMDFRRESKSTSEMFLSPINTLPCWGSKNRYKSRIMVDFLDKRKQKQSGFYIEWEQHESRWFSWII